MTTYYITATACLCSAAPCLTDGPPWDSARLSSFERTAIILELSEVSLVADCKLASVHRRRPDPEKTKRRFGDGQNP